VPVARRGIARGNRSIEAFVFGDASVEVFQELRFGGDHGTGFVLQGLEGVAEDLEERSVLVSHGWNVLEQLVFSVCNSMMPAIADRRYGQFVVTIPTDRGRGIGEYGKAGNERGTKGTRELGKSVVSGQQPEIR
jgi:hypothetical protein